MVIRRRGIRYGRLVTRPCRAAYGPEGAKAPSRGKRTYRFIFSGYSVSGESRPPVRPTRPPSRVYYVHNRRQPWWWQFSPLPLFSNDYITWSSRLDHYYYTYSDRRYYNLQRVYFLRSLPSVVDVLLYTILLLLRSENGRNTPRLSVYSK